jgi:hypothetical protein
MRMEKRQIEAHLDQYARKQIAEELRLLYGAEKLPEDLLELVDILDGVDMRIDNGAKKPSGRQR